MPTGVVYAVDGDDAVRASIRDLAESAGLRAVEFHSPEQLLTADFDDEPSCVVLELRFPDVCGWNAYDQFRERRPTVPVIFLTAHGDIPAAVRAVRAGAFDFLEKPCADDVLLERIHAALAASGEQQSALEREQARRKRLASLSEREREVLQMVVSGYATKAIARRLNISTKTVEYHRANIFSKLRVENVVLLVRLVLGVESPDGMPEGDSVALAE